MIYIIGILAAVAIPTYNDYVIKAKVHNAVIGSQPARKALSSYYQSNQQVPESLDVIGLQPQLLDGTRLSLDPKNMVLTLRIEKGEVVFTPSLNDNGTITWNCSNGEGLKPTQLSPSCLNLNNP
jgi:type IV pilus assembly protein PilA